jgi:DNA polymerase (family 10)
MPVHNYEISETLNEIAYLVEIEGANQFRVHAYREAARTISSLSQSISSRLRKGLDRTLRNR